MAEKPNKRLIVIVGGLVILIAALVGVYIIFLRPQMQEWRAVNRQLKDSEKELARLKKSFLDQDDPKIVLRNLRLETRELANANSALAKIKRRGMELKDLPPELNDPDPKIRKALIDEYMSALMKSEQENIEASLTAAKIDPPDINLFTPLNETEEAPYYINRQTGLLGIIDALVKTQTASDKKILFQELNLENYTAGIRRRNSAQNVLSYMMVLTLDMDNLISFLYNLNDEEGYYYVEKMNIKPATRSRLGGQEVKLLVDARINTVMIYESEMQKDLKKAVAASASGSARSANTGKLTGFMALAAGMKKTTQQQIEREKNKKWYEFWK